MGTHGVGKSDTGRVRDSNEDAFFVDDALGLYIVADGMGGAQAGEIAAARAIETVTTTVAASRDEVLKLRTDARRAPAVEQILRAAVTAANGAILGEARNHPELLGMGCTVTAMVVGEEAAVVAHVGDSRAYLREGGTLRQITSDHTLAAEMVKAGVMTPEVARDHAYAHILTRAVGTSDEVEIETVVADVSGAEMILLCSDGLTDHAPDTAWLLDKLAVVELDAVPDALITHANEAGGEDNITVVVVGMPERERLVRRGLLGRIDNWLIGRKSPKA